MRKPLFLLVFLLLVALAYTEIPELIHLSDDVSNDFGATSFGCQSVQVRTVSDARTPLVGNAMLAAILRPLRSFGFVPVAKTPQGAGRHLLRLSSVLRT
jgi:hypothetical protein